MFEKLSIRPAIIYGESLSSFIMRLAYLNGINTKKIMNMIYGNKRINSSYYIDILPEKVIDLSILSSLSGLRVEDLTNLTFSPMYEKFYSNIEDLTKIKDKPVSTNFIDKKRKLCLDCLNEKLAFKLIWQLKNIHLCPIHKSFLVSECNNCQSSLLYYSDELLELKCCKCGHLLSNIESGNAIEDIQYLRYKAWEDIIDLNHKFKYADISLKKEKSLAMSLLSYLHIFENNLDSFQRKELRNSLDYSRLKLFISGSIDYYHILPKIDRIIDIFKDDTDNILTREIDQQFMTQLIKRNSKEEMLGSCLAPWCKSYGSSRSMKNITEYQYRYDYNKASICFDCFMKYGFNRKTKQWEPIDNQIRLIWDIIRPSLIKGKRLFSIGKEYKLSSAQRYYAYAYCINNELLPPDINKIYGLRSIPENIVTIFERLHAEKGSMIRNAKEIYGWTGFDFYYYYTKRTVQERLCILPYRNKNKNPGKKHEELKSMVSKLLNELQSNGKDIKKQEIYKTLGVTLKTLKKYGLHTLINKSKAEQLILIKQEKANSIKKQALEKLLMEKDYKKYLSLAKIFKDLNIAQYTIKVYYPDVYNEIKQEVTKYNSELKHLFPEMYKDKIINAMHQLNNVGDKITQKNISIKAGICVSIIARSEVKKIINEEVYRMTGNHK